MLKRASSLHQHSILKVMVTIERNATTTYLVTRADCKRQLRRRAVLSINSRSGMTVEQVTWGIATGIQAGRKPFTLQTPPASMIARPVLDLAQLCVPGLPVENQRLQFSFE